MHTKYWLGSEESYDHYLKAKELATAKQDEWKAKGAVEADKPAFPPLYERIGDVGVIRVQGDLIPGEAGWLRLFGVSGYEDIKAAALEGVKDKEAKSLMIFSESPGGSVAGVEDASEFLTQVAQVKPMTAYSNQCCSAAYWLTSSASHITTSTTGMNGSLGVIRVVTEYTKAMEMEGVTKTVMRAGRYKALAGPYEVLSEEGKAEVQSKLDDLYEVFIGTVATNRGTTTLIADQVMGQGREFLGRRGVEAGLVDAVGNLDDALAYARSNRTLGAKKPANFAASATATVAHAGNLADNAATCNQKGIPMKLKLEQLAAIAAGASVEQVTGQVQESAATSEGTPEANAGENETIEATAETVAGAETAEPEAKTDSEVVTFLKTELAAAQIEASAARNEATALAGKVSALEVDLTSVMSVVQASVKNLQINLGKKSDPSKLSASELVAEHAAAQAAVLDTFKVGGVARSTASTQEKPMASIISPRDVVATRSMFKPR